MKGWSERKEWREGGGWIGWLRMDRVVFNRK